MTAITRPPIKWHGGKHYLAKRIIAQFPAHKTFVESFGGAASVLLNKDPSPVEVYADLDGRLTNFFAVVRDHGEELCRRLSLTPYSEIEFDNSNEPDKRVDAIESARRFFVQMRMSIGGRGHDFSQTLHRVRRGMADVVSGYLSAIDENLPQVIDRLRTVQIVHCPAIEVIRRWDAPETLHYLDPPYLSSTRAKGCRDVYSVEMTEDDHRELANVIRGCQGKVILSGYPSTLYDELFADWRVETFDMPNNAAGRGVKQRETECLWMNW